MTVAAERVRQTGTRGLAASGVLWRFVAAFVASPKKLSGAGRIPLWTAVAWLLGLSWLSGVVVGLPSWVSPRFALIDLGTAALLGLAFSLLARAPFALSFRVVLALMIPLAALDVLQSAIPGGQLALGYWPSLLLLSGLQAYYLPHGLPGLRRFPLPAWGLWLALTGLLCVPLIRRLLAAVVL